MPPINGAERFMESRVLQIFRPYGTLSGSADILVRKGGQRPPLNFRTLPRSGFWPEHTTFFDQTKASRVKGHDRGVQLGKENAAGLPT